MVRFSLDNVIPPIQFSLDGCKVTIYEVLRSQLVTGKTYYHVNLSLEYRGKKSKRFSIDVTSTEDLRKRLLVEIAKFKWMIMLGESV